MTEPTPEQMRAFRILLERTLGDKESGLVLVASPHPGFVDLKLGGPHGGCILSRLSVAKIVTESKQKLRDEAPKKDVFGGLESLIGSFFEDFGPLHGSSDSEKDALRAQNAHLEADVQRLTAALAVAKGAPIMPAEYTGPESGGRS